MTVAQIRRLALALPETVEQGHWGNSSFRVRGRIFATVPDAGHVNVMIDPFDVESAVAEAPDCREQPLWGGEVRGVRVKLSSAVPEMVDALLRSAWAAQGAEAPPDSGGLFA